MSDGKNINLASLQTTPLKVTITRKCMIIESKNSIILQKIEDYVITLIPSPDHSPILSSEVQRCLENHSDICLEDVPPELSSLHGI